MLGVAKPVPVPKAAPPEAFANQLKVPALAVAPKVTLPVPHLEPGVVVATAGVVLMVAVTGVLAETQLPLAAST